jgi:hypothetical protein
MSVKWRGVLLRFIGPRLWFRIGDGLSRQKPLLRLRLRSKSAEPFRAVMCPECQKHSGHITGLSQSSARTRQLD